MSRRSAPAPTAAACAGGPDRLGWEEVRPRASADQAFELDAEAGAALFRREAAALAETEDHAAALAAFTAKQEPVFKRL